MSEPWNDNLEPIDTAPKDGSIILAQQRGCFPCHMFWKDGGWQDIEYNATHHPTHWVPNPSAYWKRIANDQLRILWIIVHEYGGRIVVGPSAVKDFPGDVAEVWSHTDPEFGDFIIERRVKQPSTQKTDV